MEGPEFVLIILFLFVLPIVFTAMWMGHKKEMAKANAKLDNSEKQGLKEELNGVKKRLEVLEAIVTDKKYQLNEEIASLRVVDK
ncbi:hypothetical protein [Bowmanella denitrificans]|nr:hypothetical protein [Bowmanella denitrificans]